MFFYAKRQHAIFFFPVHLWLCTFAALIQKDGGTGPDDVLATGARHKVLLSPTPGGVDR
jgi:hypothetical protein